MTRDRSGDDAIAPTQVSANDATMQSDAGDRASPHAFTLPAPAATGDGGRFAPGSRLGRYELVGLLGKGGMGEVYAAHDPQLDRFVAVKVLLAEIRSEAASARLVREAQSLARLSHPNVVAVYDAGEDGGHVYLAMQYVEGQTLHAYLHAKQPGWQETVALFVEAGKGLAAAHAAGMIHRDFKPSNVLVDRAGKVRVTDFGVARAAGGQPDGPPPDLSNPSLASISSKSRSSRPSYDDNLTRVGELVGTPIYMSPEQFTGQATTTATDQFAFCIALWEALFGQHPYFDGSAEATVLAYAAAVQEGALILPKKTAVPKRVIAALVRGLERDPAKRWPTMDALLAALAPPAAAKRWPIAVAGAVVVLGGGAVAAALALRGDDAPALCPVPPAKRLAVVWGPAQADALAAGFAATNRAYAAKVAAEVRAGLDGYGEKWIQAVTTACSAEKAEGAVREAARRRLACLGRAHAALAGVVGQFTGKVSPMTVDNALSLVDDLPSTSYCIGDGAPLAPAAIEARMAALDPTIEELAILNRTGQFLRAREVLAEVRRDAADIAWEPFQVRIDLIAAELDAISLSADGDTAALAAIARRLKAVGNRRSELRAWTSVLQYVRDPALMAEAVTAASDAAAALGGGRQALVVNIYNGRALVRLRRFQEAIQVCTDAMTAAAAGGWAIGESLAADCLVEANVPLGRYADLDKILERDIAIKTQLSGVEHPAVADLLLVRAEILEDQGKLPDAEATVRRALEIRKRAYGDEDVRVGAALRELAGVIATAGEYDRAFATAKDALAIIEQVQPPDEDELIEIHRDLGMLAMEKEDHATVKKHFELALASADRAHGPESLQTAFLLFMYGQYQTAWDLDAGIATLHRTIELLEKHQDPRVPMAHAALGGILLRFERAEEALVLLDGALANVDKVNTPPQLLGQLYEAHARSLVATKGDKAKAWLSAGNAGDSYARAGRNDMREKMNDFIRANKLRPRKKGK
jgi:tetratricopeptide (TPR) repeat protein